MSRLEHRVREFADAAVLDYRPRWDPRNSAYAVAEVLDPAAPLTARTLPVGPRLLQLGGEGGCVGFAVAHAANSLGLILADPYRVGGPLDVADALDLYARAQRVDAFPGEDYAGTSVLAGLRVGREMGLWPEYRWATGPRLIARTIAAGTGVVLGIPWCEGMYRTGPGDVVTVRGPLVGGHAVYVHGFDPEHPALDGRPGFTWQNSHPDHGTDGVAHISARDLSWLLANRSEAGVPVPVSVPAPTVTP